MRRSSRSVVNFYNKRGTAEQWIKEGKGAIKWTRLSCRTFAANAVRLQLHALAYNLGNFLRTLATPDQMKDWSLTSLREKLIKSARSLLVMAATLHSRWPRLLSRGTSSQNFSDRSPICVRHRLACRHDAPGYRSTSQTAGEVRLNEPGFGSDATQCTPRAICRHRSGHGDHGLGRHDGESDPDAPKLSAHPVDTG